VDEEQDERTALLLDHLHLDNADRDKSLSRFDSVTASDYGDSNESAWHRHNRVVK
jgi:hypothetical protein